MQGDIFSKVWSYKDKLGNVQGPFMSFDMDIWNGEGNYFSKSLNIAPNGKDFHPLSMYIERDIKILELMQETVQKQEQKLEGPMMMRMMMPKRGQQGGNNAQGGAQGNNQGPNPFGFITPPNYPL